MKNQLLTGIIISFALLGISCKDNGAGDQPFELETFEPVEVTKSNSANIYVHYMPWFRSRDFDGYWSSHWTMENRNPDDTLEGGKRDIASHFYPKIGPYSSVDPDVIEYHLLLMKLSGIDGVFIDWYGTYDVYDYQDNLEGAEALINRVDEVGLEFGIVYEDATTENVVNFEWEETAVAAATTDMEYIQNNYFSDTNYIKADDKNVLLVFTPVYIEGNSSWSQIMESIDPKPSFLSIWGEKNDLGTTGSGEFAWVYNGNNNHMSLLTNFYSNSINRFDLGIGSAYPGFVDFYEEGGQGNFIGWEIPHNGTQTFEQTLDLAAQYEIDHLQLVTWNDFGEGTMIEPTDEFGYSMLNKVQDFAGVSYTETELDLAFQLYTLRKSFAEDEEVQEKLDQVFYYLVSLQIEEAKNLLSTLSEESE